MNTFKVYKHPEYGLEAVKVGFSWQAALIPTFWMLFQNQWGTLGLWTVGFLILVAVAFVADRLNAAGIEVMTYLGLLALWLWPAWKGSQWVEESLLERGYELVNTVQARTPEEAISKVALIF